MKSVRDQNNITVAVELAGRQRFLDRHANPWAKRRGVGHAVESDSAKFGCNMVSCPAWPFSLMAHELRLVCNLSSVQCHSRLQCTLCNANLSRTKVKRASQRLRLCVHVFEIGRYRPKLEPLQKCLDRMAKNAVSQPGNRTAWAIAPPLPLAPVSVTLPPPPLRWTPTRTVSLALTGIGHGHGDMRMRRPRV